AAEAYADSGADLSAARSPALVLASRIEDIPTTLGVPRDDPADRPLPWLPSPSVGHPGWDDHLRARAHLIAKRARALRSLTAAYREMASLEHLPDGELGEPPPEGTRRRAAYLHAQREQQREQQAEKQAMTGRPTRHTSDRPAPAPTFRQSQTRGQHLSR
ncbi:MAG: hypothetical protein J2P57_03320, partial [Acidimicrobiaceae bacterium]|nr:hypothetical protein [Acidimicrobiaceae bacterium]